MSSTVFPPGSPPGSTGKFYTHSHLQGPNSERCKTKRKDWKVGKGPVWKGKDVREDGETIIRICYFKRLLKKSVKNIKIVLSCSIFKVWFYRKILSVRNKEMIPRCVPSDCQEFDLYAIRSLQQPIRAFRNIIPPIHGFTKPHV